LSCFGVHHSSVPVVASLPERNRNFDRTVPPHSSARTVQRSGEALTAHRAHVTLYKDDNSQDVVCRKRRLFNWTRLALWRFARASSEAGVPLDIFSAGEARWLGIRQTSGEQTRMLFLSVPYALKAADARRWEGSPASAFPRGQSICSDRLSNRWCEFARWCSSRRNLGNARKQLLNHYQ